MDEAKDAPGSSRTTWSFVWAACWALLGVWSLVGGDFWQGVAKLALAAAFLVAALWPRVAAWNETPLFRRET